MDSAAMTNAMAQERSQMKRKRSVNPTLMDTSVNEMRRVVIKLIRQAKRIFCFIGI